MESCTAIEGTRRKKEERRRKKKGKARTGVTGVKEKSRRGLQKRIGNRWKTKILRKSKEKRCFEERRRKKEKARRIHSTNRKDHAWIAKVGRQEEVRVRKKRLRKKGIYA